MASFMAILANSGFEFGTFIDRMIGRIAALAMELIDQVCLPVGFHGK
jgi:hypothetical protein